MSDEIQKVVPVPEPVEGNGPAAGEVAEASRLEELLLEGLNTGSDLEVTPDFWKQLRLDAASMLRERRAS
jgi:hypothetical protein